MYLIYSTEGLILRNVARGEADRFYTILTREFGLIRAEGRGVRKLDSKLRYALQDFSLVQLSLVRGREKWRIASVSLMRNVFADLGGQAAQAILARAALLVCRLVRGEEKNERLYEHFKNAVLFLADTRPTGAVLQNTEYLLVLRILHSLGYLGAAPDWSAFTSSPIFETELLLRMEASKRQAIITINKSLKESHL
jgi:DNA repair protein RecO